MDASQVADVGTNVKSGKSTSTPDNFYMFFVVDYITNPGTFSEADIEKFTPHVKNPDELKKLTSNTILGMKVDKGTLKSAGAEVEILLPFVSHISYPVKPGEFVWAISDPLGQFRWMSRIPASTEYECVNLSTQERKTNTSTDKKQSLFDKAATGAAESATSPAAFNFPSFSSTIEDDKKHLIQFQAAKSSSEFTGEIVPRFSTKSCDLSLQGSNNSLILCSSDTATGLSEKIGTIDLVTGRGQTELTAPSTVVENERLFNEIDKTIGVERNPTEGELDYINDSSRVYISMNTLADDKFGITLESLDDTAITTTSPDPVPCVASKSTNQIMIARADGSVRIIHESGSNIIMDSDGNIQIKCGPGGQIRIGEDDASIEPAVLGDTLNSLLVSFLSHFSSSETPGNLSPPIFVATGVGPGVLAPPVVAAADALILALKAKDNLSTIIKVQ
jgi:hypothetical protein